MSLYRGKSGYILSPSVLSADFSKLGEDVKAIAKTPWVHLDVMDGAFVPNITFGAVVIKAVRPLTKVPFDVHLMIDNPLNYIEDFVKAGADIITFHVEAKSDIQQTIDKINSFHIQSGLVIKPNTPAEVVFPYLKTIDMVLIMTVEPGFGGQSFMADMLPKALQIKEEAMRQGTDIVIEADGGINEKTISQCAEYGIDICVSGTGVFKAENPKQAITYLKSF